MNRKLPFPTHSDQTLASDAAVSASFTIREAHAHDLSSMAEILTDSFHDPKGWAGWLSPFLRMGIYEDLRYRLRSPNPHYVCLVAQVESAYGSSNSQLRVVGTVEMTLRSNYSWPTGGLQYPYISNLAVQVSHRRQGVAKLLLAACEEMALHWGFAHVYLHVLENNHSARRLYFKLGYRLQQVDANWTSWAFGQPRRILLRKSLPIAS